MYVCTSRRLDPDWAFSIGGGNVETSHFAFGESNMISIRREKEERREEASSLRLGVETSLPILFIHYKYK
jgi:hypothetical protein